MRKPWKLFFSIILLTLVAAIISLPKNVPVHISRPFSFNTTVSSPDINLTFGPISIHKDINTHLGLDLQGGTHLVLEANMDRIPPGDRATALEAVRQVIDRRVNFYGVSEPVIQTAKVGDSYRIIVELPGIKNIDEAISLVGKTAQLSFREIEASPSAQTASPSAQAVAFTKETPLNGKHLKKSQVQFDTKTGQPLVSLEFNDEGAKLFEEITRNNIGRPLAIFLDNEILSAPRVDEAIVGGNAVIRGNFTTEEAKNLSIALNAGALPAPVSIIQQKNIGATLGVQAVHASLLAGFLGLGVVAFFMIASYGKKGVLAVAALIVYALVVLALFKLIPVTLTLAGIAGFILSIGMAVDANILIFERIKEEERSGKSMQTALELGFSRAFPSIRDSNVSSLITCAILYWFGSGSVRGFALTLAVGIMVSLFSAITVTRTLLRIFHK